tara:strand:+ start:1359 stop:1925 length:567 start_codon:yes stop_codon:yes gene_type:complete
MTKSLPLAVQNLRKIWDQKKIEMRFTQVTAAKDLDWSQGAISHYLNGLTDLGPAAVIKLANFLDVDPTEIDPGIEPFLPHVQRLDISYNSTDMTKRLKTQVYTRDKTVSTFVRLIKDCKVVNSNEVISCKQGRLEAIAQLITIKDFPQAKLHAVKLKDQKELEFHLPDTLIKPSSISTRWAVVSVMYV